MIEIIPAIDIIDGEVVRLVQGDFKNQTIYNKDPLKVAKKYEQHGIKRLHIVDLDGARQRHIVNWQALRYISEQTDLKIDFGGGIRSSKDLEMALSNGADQVVLGSIAVKKKVVVRSWVERFGSERLILGADVRDNKIAINGWSEITDINIFDFIESYLNMGIDTCICTDIEKDGMLQGPSFDLYSEIKNQFPDLKLIASGGISGIEDISKLEDNKVDGVIIGKALYDGKINIEDLSALHAD